MDCSCNCFGIAASSKKPVKRYNLLVPDIFPKTPPPFLERIDPSTERKLKKLYEYLEKNLNRGPKISRRLARRINKELSSEQLGYVQIAVAAYIYLLEHLRDADSPLFAKEVICQQVAKPIHFYHHLTPTTACVSNRTESASALDTDSVGSQLPLQTGQFNHSVVGVLLNHPSAEMHALGADLLSSFTRQQATAEYLAHTEAFVELLCRDVGRLPEITQPNKALQMSALRALQEQIRLCIRVSASMKSLEPIVNCLLDTILPQREPGMKSQELSQNEGVKAHPPSASTTCPERELALEVFKDVNTLTQGPAEGKKFVECLLQYVDKHQDWNAEGHPSNAPVLALLWQCCTEEQQRYLAFSVFVGHVSTPALSPLQQLSVAVTACREETSLPSSLASAALVLTVKEFVPLIADSGQQTHPDIIALKTGLLDCIRGLAARLADLQHLLEALSGITAKAMGPAPLSTAFLECILAAADALKAYKAQEGRGPSLPQPLLQELMLMMVTGEPPLVDFAHRLLQALLRPGLTHLRDQQVHPLLSAAWHQAHRPTSPDVLATLSLTLGNMVSCASLESSQPFALMANQLQEDALASEDAAGSPASRLARVLLGDWLWTCLDRQRPSSLRLELLNLCAGLEAPHLRCGESGLECTGNVLGFSAADDTRSAAVLEEVRQRKAGDARLLAVTAATRGWNESETPESGGPVQPFVPLPISGLQPKGKGHWAAAVGSRLAEQSGTDRLSNRLRARIRNRTTEQLESHPTGIQTIEDFVQAAKAEVQRMEDGRGEARCMNLSAQAENVLAAVDRLLETRESEAFSYSAGNGALAITEGSPSNPSTANLDPVVSKVGVTAQSTLKRGAQDALRNGDNMMR